MAFVAKMKLPSNMAATGTEPVSGVRSPERLPQSYNPRPVAVDRGRCDFKSLSHKKDWERKGFIQVFKLITIKKKFFLIFIFPQNIDT